ncbi:MAG TPA: hypothetical protein VJ302_34330, partial [Blastocatellia bacterium]|nr:hypothetical protein [Blastocatellia bacterium]
MIYNSIHYSISRRSLQPFIYHEIVHQVVAGRASLLLTAAPARGLHLMAATRRAPLLLLVAACLLGGSVAAQEKADPVEDLIRQLRSPNYNLRYDAAGRLAQLGPKARGAVPALTAALK